MKRDHYETLGVKRDAGGEDIKRAFRRKAKECHPDQGGEHEKFLALQRAFKTLGDDEARAHYDETGRDAEDHAEANRAEEMLVGLMLKVIAEAPCVDGLDLVKLVGEEIKLIEIQLEIELRQIPDCVEKVKRAIERIRNPEGNGFLVAGLKRAAAGLEQSLETLQRKKELTEEMKRLIEPHQYDFDEVKKPDGYEGPLVSFLMQGLQRMGEASRQRREAEERRRDPRDDPRYRQSPYGPTQGFNKGW